MKLLYLLAALMLSACASYTGPERLSRIDEGQCYFYYRSRHWISHYNAEIINPFVYRKISSRGGSAIIEQEFRRWGGWFRDTIHVKEVYLLRFSTPIDCEQMEAYSRLKPRDMRRWDRTKRSGRQMAPVAATID